METGRRFTWTQKNSINRKQWGLIIIKDSILVVSIICLMLCYSYADVSWAIETEGSDGLITVSIIEFDTEFDYDKVFIYDGMLWCAHSLD